MAVPATGGVALIPWAWGRDPGGGCGEGDGENLVGVPAGGSDLDLEDVGTEELAAELGAEAEVEDLPG